MGFKYSYTQQDLDNGAGLIHKIHKDIVNKYADGFTQWGAKQDLYRLKFLLDDVIKNTPEFALEKEWLREQEKRKILRILKNEM